uniref:Fatty acid synthase pseudo-KR domain-containing protein n=1 Tax=Romanomermis culicivorax TaxID=13658 RepID=A0A915IRE2_ROMCU
GIDFVDAINDLETFGCSAGGVEICDLVAQSVARRPSPSNVTVERVQFVPYFDSECLSGENVALVDNLIAYRKTCRHLALSCAKNFLDLKSALPGDENLHEFEVLKRILATAAYNDSAKNQNVDDMKTTLAYFLQEMELCSAKNGQPVTETYAKTEKILKTDFERILRSDKMWNFCWTDLLEKPVKVLLDIVCENTAGHHLKGAFLEVEDLIAAKFLKNLHTTHPLLDGQWIMIGPDADKLEDKDAANVDACFSYYPISSLENSQIVNKLLEKCGNLDLVVLDRILQSKLDVVSYLRSGAALLRDDGFMIVCETTSDFETSYILGLFYSLAQGNLSEFLSNNLNGFRKYGLFYEHEYWMSVFNKCGFQIIAHQYDKRSPYTMYLLRKLSPRDLEPAYVPIDDVEKFAWVEPLQEVILQRLNDPQEKTIWITSNTTKDNGIAGLALCLREESYKNRMRCIGDISLSPEKRSAEELKLSLQTLNDILHKDVTMNLHRDGIWGSMRHIPLKK